MNRAVVFTRGLSSCARTRAPGDGITWVELGLAALGVLAIGLTIDDSLREMARAWTTEEEYSHGALIPFVAAFLVWRAAGALGTVAATWRAAGVAVVLGATALAVASEIAAVYTLAQYAFVALLAGMVVALIGIGALRVLATPLLLLGLAVPLPFYLQVELTSGMQLLSSKLGVLVIEALGIPVFLEGNLIDLGAYQLQVLEACSGLSYLFPLAAFALFCACLFQGTLWQRAIIVLLAIPITILMNSARIAIAGVLVDRFGPGAADGFIHGFEGWLVFVVSLALLFGAMALLARTGSAPRTLRAALDMSVSRARFGGIERSSKRIALPVAAATAIAIVGALAVNAFAQRPELVPARTPLALFPLRLGEHHGEPGRLDRATVDALKLDDYLLADYVSPLAQSPVELYVAWYDSQRNGASPHSPKVCLPAGGWEISRFERGSVDIAGDSRALPINRVVMQKGTRRLLAYYWFQQRGHTFANEYTMKWHLFRDALTLHRSDGALIRLVTPIDGDTAIAEARLADFLDDLWPRLPAFVPN